MTYLSDTARVVLAAAAQRADLSVLPFPDGCKAKGGAEQKVLAGLNKRGLIRIIETDGGPQRVVITSEGMAAIGIEEDDAAPEGATEADTGATPAEAAGAGEQPQATTPATEADRPGTPARSKVNTKAAKAKAVKPGKAAPAEKPTPRAGTKQALMIDMLKRPEGATVEQIAAATGWQHHTIRGAISGALKKKLGLSVEATRTREVGPNKTSAKGSATTYRITGSPSAAG
jgi:Protein of unknown function (DUF3489)